MRRIITDEHYASNLQQFAANSHAQMQYHRDQWIATGRREHKVYANVYARNAASYASKARELMGVEDVQV